MTRRTVKLADNTISAEEMSSLADWLKEGHQVTKGPLTRQFEAEFATKKAALAAELDVKLEQRRAAKNMIVSLVFILRLLG